MEPAKADPTYGTNIRIKIVQNGSAVNAYIETYASGTWTSKVKFTTTAV